MKSTILRDWREPLLLKADNAGAYYLATNDARNLNDRTKHIDIKHHFIREKVQDKELTIEQVPSTENVADILTKPLARAPFEKLRSMLGVQPPPTE